VSAPEVEPLRVVAGILVEAGRVLVTQRTREQRFGLKWEFPGGKIEAGESPEEALVREFREELGIETRALSPYDRIRYRDAWGKELDVVFHRIERTGGEPVPLEVAAVAWVPVDRLAGLDMIPANRGVVDRLVREGGDAERRDG
jgi:8-oxo-dGTP diphosphatase